MSFPIGKKVLIRGVQAHIAAGLGAACDYEADNFQLRAPFDGEIYNFGSLLDQGGLWLGLKRPNGDRIEMAHLSARYILEGPVKEGQLIGRTGNTGTLTTGPHLHIQILNSVGTRLDPEQYDWGLALQIQRVGLNLPPRGTLITQIANYSDNSFEFNISDYTANIPSPLTGTLTLEESYQIVETLDLKARFIILYYTPNADSVYYSSFYYPKRNCCITTAPAGDPRSLAFEFSHQLQEFYNANRGEFPYIQIDDSMFPSDVMIYSKYDSIRPYIPILGGTGDTSKPIMLTEKEVRQLQALEGYNDPAGVTFWGDGTHTLDEYLAKRLPDKISTIDNSML